MGNHDDDYSDDDEMSPLNGSEEKKSWDVFENTPPQQESGSMESLQFMAMTLKIVKVIVYILTFSLVLGGAVVAKGTLVFMTSQIKENQTRYACYHDHSRISRLYHAELGDTERSAWIWVLIFSFWVTECGTFVRSLRICLFKSAQNPQILHFLFVFLMETLHTIGLVLLVFVVLPELDVVRAVMITNCVCFVPGFINLLTRPTNKLKKVFLDSAALLAQVSGLFVWPSLEQDNLSMWAIPLALFLTSCGWWENYIVYNENEQSNRLMKFLKLVKKDLTIRSRYRTYFYISVWKMALFFGFTILIVYLNGEIEVENFFHNIHYGFQNHFIQNRSTPSNIENVHNLPNYPSNFHAPLYVFVVHILAAYISYISAKWATKILIQEFSYSLPVLLSVPVSVIGLFVMCWVRSNPKHEVNMCAYEGVIPNYLFFNPPSFNAETFLGEQHAWIWMLWFISQFWITFHLWSPKIERLATTEKIFVTPLYSSFLIDQSLALNRRKDNEIFITIEKEEMKKETEDEEYKEDLLVEDEDQITRLYACTTLWHETKDEMIEMLKSILRMDADQSSRRLAKKYFQTEDPNYYEMETHILFDDAFVSKNPDKPADRSVNDYVKTMMDTINQAAVEVHETNYVKIKPPIVYPTPYGGRLVYTLPGKTKIYAHLKDKSKIRHKKRWSQCMYMYYILGHRLMELDIPVSRKSVRADNTFLLALDGDIDFQPNAVHLLIDLMRKNLKLGACCGRIHPIGAGPMVWYQKFEYAIAHWLQKATEHVIGCVLCSPGCFSLFRGKALMDDGVMNKYTTMSSQARHYVQYDQGEDRWLCTLLLQRGYRVEYSAASDAYTHCPESFNEFYTQRRRWVPSTMANIMDLLGDSRRTVQLNDNISKLYIAYQYMLLGGAILGPGTIFLMLVGALVAAFNISNNTAFMWNIFPILIFMAICLLVKEKIQLFVAGVLTQIYAIIMMAVLVGMLLQIKEDGPFAPSTLFLFIVASEFVLAAVFHPQEFWCLPCGAIYYVIIPSMYLLLMIYSVCNLNVVNWGTREVVEPKSREELEKEKQEAEEAKKNPKNNTLLGFFQAANKNDEEGALEFSFAGLFKLMLCTHKKPINEQEQLLKIANNVDIIQRRINHIEKIIDPHATPSSRRRTTVGSREQPNLMLPGQRENIVEDDSTDENDDATTASIKSEEDKRDDLVNPFWLDDEVFEYRRNNTHFLLTDELEFWDGLIEKYLKPIKKDKKKEDKAAKELKDLRNVTVLAFFMLNALFVTAIYLLQMKKDIIFIKWPAGAKANITYDDTSLDIQITKEYLQLEPIGLVFILFFAVIMIIQFIAMVFHRWGTFSHIMAITVLWRFGKVEKSTYSLRKNGVEAASKIQRLRGINEDEDDEKQNGNNVERRKTIANLEKNKKKKKSIETLEEAFKKRFFNEDSEAIRKSTLGLRRETIMEINKHRQTFIEQRRMTRIEPMSFEKSQKDGGKVNFGIENTETDVDAVVLRKPNNRTSVRFQ